MSTENSDSLGKNHKVNHYEGFSLLPWLRVEGNVPSGWEGSSEQVLTDIRGV